MKRALLTPGIESGLDAKPYPSKNPNVCSYREVFWRSSPTTRLVTVITGRSVCPAGQGNGLCVEGFGIVEEPGAFRAHWEEAAQYNQLVDSRLISHREPDCGPYNWVEEGAAGDLKFVPLNWVVPFSRRCASPVVSAVKGEGLLGEPPKKSDFSPKSVEDAKYLLKVGWTGRGQTQQLQLAALMVARTRHAEADLLAMRFVSCWWVALVFMTTAVTLRRFFVRSDLVTLLVRKLLFSILFIRAAGRRQRIRSDQKMRLCAQWCT